MNGRDIAEYEASSRALEHWRTAPLTNALQEAGVDYTLVVERQLVRTEDRDFSRVREYVRIPTKRSLTLLAVPESDHWRVVWVFDRESEDKAPEGIRYGVRDVVDLAAVWQLGCDCGGPNCRRPRRPGG